MRELFITATDSSDSRGSRESRDSDTELAECLAVKLEAAGFSVASHSRLAAAGESAQAAYRIAGSAALLLLASRETLGSPRVAEDLMIAEQRGKPCVLLLRDLLHENLLQAWPGRAEFLDRGTSIPMPDDDVAAAVELLLIFLEAAGLRADAPASEAVTRPGVDSLP